MKKYLSILLAVVLLVTVMSACAKKQETFVSIATGGTGGTYYPLGAAMAKILNDHVKDVSANAQVTNASVENIGLVGSGEVEIAFIQNDITYYAFTGTEMFADKDKVENISGLAVLYPELVQIIARVDANIQSIEDLRGKRVAVGAPGSGAEANARQVLEIHGLTYDDLGKADFLSFSESADQIKNNQLDAAFLTAGIPTSALTEVAQTSDIVVVSITADMLAALSAKYPFYTSVEIPAGTYRNQDTAVMTAAVMAMLVVQKDLSNDLVYNMTKSIFENRQDIIDAHTRGNDIKLETALSGMPIAIHPGAQKYYDEKGIK